MKNRYFILSVLFWAVASVAMAVVLPSSPFEGSSFYSEVQGTDFSISTGASYTNFSLRVSNTDEDGIECGNKVANGGTSCEACCNDVLTSSYGDEWYMDDAAEAKYGDCMATCEGWSLGDEETPLGTPLCLLPFIAIYAVIRRNRKDKE